MDGHSDIAEASANQVCSLPAGIASNTVYGLLQLFIRCSSMTVPLPFECLQQLCYKKYPETHQASADHHQVHSGSRLGILASACVRGRPLQQAIKECEAKWYHETLQAAKDGDITQMALLGHMLNAGYGCTADPGEAQKWYDEASKKLGYNVLTEPPPSNTDTASNHKQ